jgi:GH24 family phage-related lysozyme (muramidase)
MAGPIGSGTFNKNPGSVQNATTDRVDVNTLSLSPQGEAFIKEKEDKRLFAYNDNRHFCTEGYGHLIHGEHSCESEHIPNHRPISQATADQEFDTDKLRTQESCVRRHVEVPLYQREYDALCSLAFNIGDLHAKAPHLLQKLNNGQYSAAASEFLDITNHGTHGLVVRRKEEYEMFMHGNYDATNS